MYKFKNGILHHNGKPIFGIGVSYYPSFYPGKAPVTDESKQIPEMKIDLKKMKDFGINIIRTAAIGKVYKENCDIICDTPLIDEMLAEAEKDDIAVMIRLQGYHMNISGYDNFRMKDENGKEVSPDKWNAFIQSCMHHEGIKKDNELATKELTKHYSEYESFVSFCVYNEPHYPGNGYYDYHPDTVREYRKWLIKNKIMSEKEAENYMPPRERPVTAEGIGEWVNWRLFSLEAMSKFLKETHDYSKSVNSELEGITSAVTTQFMQGNDTKGVDNFAYARDMDICGYTNYQTVCGTGYYSESFIQDFLDSCAALHGKHCWIVEYDARTNISSRKFEQETYIAVGSGVKGIMYYQWRGDAPTGATEEDNAFGLLNYDGTETENFEEKRKVIELLKRYSDYFVNSERMHNGVAILHSDYMALFQAAHQKKGCYVANSYEQSMRYIYRDFIDHGYAVDFVKAEHLKENKLDIKCLIVPEFDYMMSDEEKKQVDNFAKAGGFIFMYSMGAYNEYKRTPESLFSDENCGGRTFDEMIEMSKIKPLIDYNIKNIKCKVLKGNDFYIIAVNNISTLAKASESGKIKCNFIVSEAKMVTPNAEKALKVHNNTIDIPPIDNGALVILK
ncbi:MAG: beta-galactosidase [Clostridia bacterium]|nr:beta-galactosidase [Clostridia bacterium]